MTCAGYRAGRMFPAVSVLLALWLTGCTSSRHDSAPTSSTASIAPTSDPTTPSGPASSTPSATVSAPASMSAAEKKALQGRIDELIGRAPIGFEPDSEALTA